MLDAEDEVIEEYVMDEDEEQKTVEACTEDESEQLHANTTEDAYDDDDDNETRSSTMRKIKCVDSILVGKLKARERQKRAASDEDVLRREEEQHEEDGSPSDGCTFDYFDFTAKEKEEYGLDESASESPSPSWAQMSSEDEITTEPTTSRYLNSNPLPASKLQLKMKDKSLCAQVFAYNLTVNKARPQQNMKYVPLGKTQSKLPGFKVKDEDLNEISNAEEEAEEEQEEERVDNAHCLRKASSVMFSNRERFPQNVPMIDYTTRFYNSTNKRLNRWKNVNKNAQNVMHLDDEQLFVWRSVKQKGNDFQSLFVVTAPKGDSRMRALLQKLQMSTDNNIYANQGSCETSESE